MRKVFLALAFGLAASCAHAQTPSPADVGIVHGNPDVFKLLDSSKTWTPFGSIDPTTHIFTPVGGGGGGGASGLMTLYPTHALLTAGITAPSGSSSTVMQQGFYAPGDGGAATYQWNLTSYCTGGTSGAPTPADGIGCVLPVGQSASSAGRYLLQIGNGVDVRQIGMVGDGVFDNLPLVPTLMSLMEPANSQESHMDIFFPAKLQQRHTDYYFSQSFHIYRIMNIKCPGIPNGGGDSSARLVFPAGVHGLVFDNPYTTPPNAPGGGAFGGGGMSGCGIVSKGFHYNYVAEAGDTTINNVPVDAYFNTWDFKVGDGVVPYQYGSPGGAPSAPQGTAITAVNSGTHSITLSNPLTKSYTGGNNFAIWRLPVEDAFTVNTTIGSGDITVTGGPSLLRMGDYIWSDAFPFGTPILDASGTLGAQTVTTGPYNLDYNNPTPATKTETGGKMWILPAAIKTFVGFQITNNWIGTFPWGLEMACSDWSSTAPSGCNGSFSQQNQFVFSMIGRLALGNNSGANASIMNVYAENSITDIAEFGSVGSNYYSENANSQEHNTSVYGVIGMCGISFPSNFNGGYMPTTGGYCANGIGVPTSPGGQSMFIGQIVGTPQGAPSLNTGNFYNNWEFDNSDTFGSAFCLNGGTSFLFAFTTGGEGYCGFSWVFKPETNGYWDLTYDVNSGGPTMWLPDSSYTGYLPNDRHLMTFMQGITLYDNETGTYTPGLETLLDTGPSVPSGTYHKPGDIHFNQNATAGQSVGWVNGAYFTGYIYQTGVVGTTTTTYMPVCPPASTPVGTRIYDVSGTPAFIGTFASCVPGSPYPTLTLQAPTVFAWGNGDTVSFVGYQPFGPVANDPAGTQWTLGNYMTLIPVALASLPTTCTAGTFAVINNGVASPTYNAAVGATTGAATDPVFCTNGNVWKYH